jgi:hypothetical protein
MGFHVLPNLLGELLNRCLEHHLRDQHLRHAQVGSTPGNALQERQASVERAEVRDDNA